MFNVESLNIAIPQTPRGNRLLVLPLAKASAGTILDMEENRELPEKGLVLAVGPGGFGAETGQPIPVEATVGELVCYGKYAGMKVEIAGPDEKPLKLFIMRDTEVLLAQPAATLDLVVHDHNPRTIHEANLHCELCPKVTGEAGVNRLREVAYGDSDAALDAERARQDDPLVSTQ